MPLEMSCTGCGRKLRAPESAAGKKIRCPNCQAIQEFPAETLAATTAHANSATEPAVEQWQMKVPGGQTYGPVTKTELDSWVKEGRVTNDCHLLRVGTVEWQWASAIYPGIAAPQPTAPAMTTAVAYSAAPAYAAPGYSGYAGNPYAAAPYAPSLSSPKSKWVAVLLAFLTFGFGIHRFYLGHVGLGVAILLLTWFCGVGLVWQWIEGFLLIFGVIDRDNEGRLLQ